MSLEVLVSTMHQTDHRILENMNIQSDAIIINQCDHNGYEEFKYNGNSVRFFSFNERGVGLSRNNALMRVNSDICLFADEDMVYVEGYKKMIIDAFEENTAADVIVFNVLSLNPEKPLQHIMKKSRVRWFNCLKYGAVNIAARTEKLRQANICFSLLFGGGAKYSAGEDSLFIAESIKKDLKIFSCPQIIGYAKQEESTWFGGYTDKYFIDKGALYYCLSKRWCNLLCLQFCIRHQDMFINEKTWKEAFLLMLKGKDELKG